MWHIQVVFIIGLASLHFAASGPVRDDVQQSVLGDPSSTASNIHKSLKKAEVIPDVLDDDLKPLFSINVTYPSAHKVVDLGNKIKPKAVSSPPNVIVNTIGKDDEVFPSPTIHTNATYTFILTDPDATSRSDPTKAEMCHWIVTGITFNASSEDHILHLPIDSMALEAPFHFRDPRPRNTRNGSDVEELMSYFPPAPPPATGYHRYVFVLLQSRSHKHGQDDAGPQKPSERPHWGYGKVGKGVRDWAKDNELTPVGANFFYARNKNK
ncbi:MAG: hypothetical protein Q9216_001010 [Gyalolechia sp. 2 TL-2023]